MCKMSCVTCHVSVFGCHVSIVTININIFFCKVFELFSGGSVINGAYPLQLSHSFNWSSFRSGTSRYCLSQTVRAGELKFRQNVHPPQCVTCHMSHVTGVTYQVSGVRCQVFQKVVELVGVQPVSPGWGVNISSRCRVCYQRGLPRLVSELIEKLTMSRLIHQRHFNWKFKPAILVKLHIQLNFTKFSVESVPGELQGRSLGRLVWR